MALQGLYFCVLALSAMVTAMPMSHGSSTYVWQLPSRCLITGTLASALMRSISPLPPRGMITSTYSGMVIKRPTAARSVVGTSCTASSGKPAAASAWCTSTASALFDSMASLPPRRMQALPLLMLRLAASIVTLGRLSKIMPKTPIGTRICPTRMPLGCSCKPLMVPITSGIAANCRQPSCKVSITLGVRRKRSTIGALRPASWARAISCAFAACKKSLCSPSTSANACRAAFFWAADADAMRVAAWRAPCPMTFIICSTFSSSKSIKPP